MVGGTHNMPRVSGAEREARNIARDGRGPMDGEFRQEGNHFHDNRGQEGGRRPMDGEFRQPDNRIPEQRTMPEPPPPPQEPVRPREKKSFRKKSGCCLFTLIGMIAVVAAGIAAFM